MTRVQVAETFIDILAAVTERPAEELAANPDAKMKEDLSMTSMQYFPLISELEEKLDLEVDYSGFLTAAGTINQGIDFIYEMVKG